MPSYWLGETYFPSKQAAAVELARLLRSTPEGQPLTGPDLALVSAAISQHPDAARKQGAGVASVTVRSFDYGSPCFWITRVDGTQTDFSYRKALAQPTHRSDVLEALRRLVRPQVHAWLDDAFSTSTSLTCPLTGAVLRRGDGHVDHVIGFTSLAWDFLTHHGLTFSDVTVVSADGRPGRDLADARLAADWVDWHGRRAVLRYVHPAANTRRGAA